MVALNLSGLFLCMRKVAKRWIAAGRGGRIINLASFAGVVADPMSAPYAATKGGVVQLTRTCAVEWAKHGILVNAIGPGYVRTDTTAHTLDHPETGASVRARTPPGGRRTRRTWSARPFSSLRARVGVRDGAHPDGGWGWTAW
ncbi:MAG: SDR family oxidoreductase [Candidatus Eisenbacteria bacterium]